MDTYPHGSSKGGGGSAGEASPPRWPNSPPKALLEIKCSDGITFTCFYSLPRTIMIIPHVQLVYNSSRGVSTPGGRLRHRDLGTIAIAL